MYSNKNEQAIKKLGQNYKFPHPVIAPLKQKDGFFETKSSPARTKMNGDSSQISEFTNIDKLFLNSDLKS